MQLGDSFHPGGLRLTKRLTRGRRVLDVASGKGESAIFLAEAFGCEVGVSTLVRKTSDRRQPRTGESKAAHPVCCCWGDAEKLDFPDAGFDAIVCDCAFCTFPDKRAADEFVRVLKPGAQSA